MSRGTARRAPTNSPVSHSVGGMASTERYKKGRGVSQYAPATLIQNEK